MANADSDDDVPEELQCPVCFEVPSGEVFQCVDGHVICKECYGHITQCPQCRVPFGQPPIRNRLMETMLAARMPGCKFAKFGCDEKLGKAMIHKHEEKCIYDFER